MLEQLAPAHPMEPAIQAYLRETLGFTLKVRPWPGAGKLPYFLQDGFEVRELELMDRPILLAINKQPNKPSLANVRSQMDKLRQFAGVPVLYVTGALASYERKRLVEQRVPFIVPGNQLYLPDLGIDLREYFRQCRETADKSLSPATQALLISALLKPWKAEVHPAELGERLSYTTMTLSRAVKELEHAGLASVVDVGRKRRLHFDDNTQAIWRRALPMLRDPVKKSVWAMPDSTAQKQARLAGESALASATLLAEPAHPIYAISTEQWKLAQQQG